MHLEFFGAAAEVTGSCHILRVGKRQVLLDCGLIQGSRKDEKRNADPFPFDAAKIDAVVLSHAHLDHCGRLPLLVKRGFRGPVYAQEASCELAAILLADAAHLQERDAEYRSRKTGRRVKPLYTHAEGEAVMRQLRGVKYREVFDVVEGVQVRFRDAGHILGSCTVEVWAEEAGVQRKIVFSGDLGQYDTPILRDPEPLDRADVVLMESTYGGRRHRSREETVAELGEILTSSRSRKGRSCTSWASTTRRGNSTASESSWTARWRSRRRRCTGTIHTCTTRRPRDCGGKTAACRCCPTSR
jgi:metallo-beta-lactamase family protein